MRRAFIALLIAPLAIACGARDAWAGWRTVEERWWVQELGAKPCGRMVERVEEGDGDDAGRVRTSSRVELRFRRAGQETRVELESVFVETTAGEPVEASVAQGGGAPVRYRFAKERGAWVATVDRGAAGAGERKVIEGDFLTPRAASALVVARHKAGAAEIGFRAIDVQSGLTVAEIVMTRREAEGAQTRYATRNSLVPVVGSELLDAEGRSVETTVDFPGLGEFRSRLADKPAADRAYDAATFDLLVGTFAKTAPIARYEERPRLAFTVRAIADGGIDLPSEGAQVARRIDARTQRVEVDVMRGSAPAAGDATDGRWLRATELLDFESEPVRELLAKARLPKDGDAYRDAEALRRLVFRHLRRKDLATAFGSASEAARTQGGDCTEHAVLLAALLRAKGIPSRVASGLVYVPSMAGQGPGFGWHLWTQALVPAPDGGKERVWLDLDATLGGGGRGYHAAHILVATSDLAGGATDPAFARAVGMVGGVAIELDAEKGGAK
ncbi:MAG: transglutaminase family protein [Planctomycetota bacterium]|nr:transglutaminase family protein [Planctomycetota bacterium]